MAQSDVLRMLMEIDTGSSTSAIDQVTRKLKEMTDAGAQVSAKTFVEATQRVKEMGEAANQHLPVASEHLDRIRRTSEDAGRSISVNMPQARRHVEEFGHTWKKTFEEMNRAHESIVKSLEPALGAMGLSAITATASVGGLIEAVRKFAEAGHELSNLGKETGASVQFLDRYIGTAREVGTTSEAVSGAVKDLGTQFQHLKTVSGGELFAGLSRAGRPDIAREIKNTEGDKNLTDQEKYTKNFERLVELARELEASGKSEAQVRATFSQIGIPPDLANFARVSPEQFKKMADEAQRLRGTFDTGEIEKYEAAITRAENAFEGLSRVVGGQLLPPLTNLTEKLTELLSDSKGDFTTGLKEFVQYVTENTPAVIKELNEVASFLNRVQGGLDSAGKWGFEHIVSPIEHATNINPQAVQKGFNDAIKGFMGPGPDPLGPGQKQIGNIGDMLKPIKPGQFAVGADEITTPGLAFIHEGEQIRPAESNGPYRSADASPFQAAHSAENRRTVDENTAQVKVLNEKLQKLIDGDTADGTAGGGVFGGGGAGAGARAGNAGGLGGGAAAGLPSGAAGAVRGLMGNAGLGDDAGSNYGSSSSSAPGGSEGSVGQPGGASFEDSQGIGKAGGLAAALKGADGSGFASSLPSNHPAVAAAQQAARNLATGGATGGGVAAGFKDSGSGFSKAQAAANAAGGGASVRATGGGKEAYPQMGAIKAATKEQFLREGYTDEQAERGANVAVGQAIAESGLRSQFHDAGKAAGRAGGYVPSIYGADHARGQAMTAWMKQNGLDPNSTVDQGKWMAHEMATGHYPQTQNAIKNGSLAQASDAATREYEAPASRNSPGTLAERRRNAELVSRSGTETTQNAAGAPQPPSAPSGTPTASTDVNPPGHVGDDRDQSQHTTHMSGQVEMDGQSYGWGSGMPGHPATPFGDYYINRGNLGGFDPDTGNPRGGGVGPLGQSGWGGRLPPAIAGLNSVPEGNMRGGEELHAGSATSDRLDQLYTAGCFAVAKDQWPQFKANLMAKAQREGKLMLHLHPGKDGKPIASITGTNGTSRVATTNARPIPSSGLRPFPTDGLNPPKASADSIPEAARNPNFASERTNVRFPQPDAPHTDAEAAIRDPRAARFNPAGSLSASADKASSMTHKVDVNGTGHIKVDVNGPAGTKASAKGSGLFNKTTLNRNMANERSSEHSQSTANR